MPMYKVTIKRESTFVINQQAETENEARELAIDVAATATANGMMCLIVESAELLSPKPKLVSLKEVKKKEPRAKLE